MRAAVYRSTVSGLRSHQSLSYRINYLEEGLEGARIFCYFLDNSKIRCIDEYGIGGVPLFHNTKTYSTTESTEGKTIKRSIGHIYTLSTSIC